MRTWELFGQAEPLEGAVPPAPSHAFCRGGAGGTAPSIMIFAACMALGVCGCTSTEDPTRKDLVTAGQMASQVSTPERLKPYHQRLYMEGESNATLNRMRLVSVAMEQGQWKEAESALDAVLPQIEALGPADERSRGALSKFSAEDIKRFKGEAHERSMAYLLRGLLYLRKGDWSNARACFKSVQIQDAAKVDASKRANWASADWLQGWCAHKLGQESEARECWERARTHLAGTSTIPRPTEGQGALCVALLGYGPVKVSKGAYGEHLSYQPAPSEASGLELQLEGNSLAVPMAEDLLSQATSRGLRKMDLVNENKADTRAGTDTAGNVLAVGGVGVVAAGAVKGDGVVAAAGLGAVGLGLATKGIASSMNPKSDTRNWDLLPATIHLVPFHAPENAREIPVRFMDERGATTSKRRVPMPGAAEPQVLLIFER